MSPAHEEGLFHHHHKWAAAGYVFVQHVKGDLKFTNGLRKTVPMSIFSGP